MLLKFNKKIFIFTFFISTSLFGELPIITSNNNDIIYKQFIADTKENVKRLKLNQDILPLQFYIYKIKDGDTIFSVAARFNINYDTIASLNSIENQLFFNSINELIIPTCPGLFLNKEREKLYKEININNRTLYFYPGKSFSGKERLNFLVTPFSSPLKKMVVTSEFGYRENPFTNNTEFHSGLDIKANVGTKIYASYNGEVNNVGYSEFYGNFLIVKHNYGYSSHYYHLDRILVKQGDKVNKGEIIALTGNSGKSTGPHLHFEIQLNNEPINPRILLGDV